MSDTPTYEQLSALCAQMATALEKIKVAYSQRDWATAVAHEMEHVRNALTAYRTLSPDPQWQRVPESMHHVVLTEEEIGRFRIHAGPHDRAGAHSLAQTWLTLNRIPFADDRRLIIGMVEEVRLFNRGVITGGPELLNRARGEV